MVASKNLPYDRLGYLDIPTRNIYLSSVLEVGSPRYRFVLAHEYGHFVLHGDILDNKIAVLYENDDTLKSLCASNEELKILERQANRFASYLLMPRYEFVMTVIELFGIFDIRKGFMYVDSQPCNLKDYHNVTSRLSAKFIVSNQAAAYRMIDLGLLKVNEADRLVVGI
ncbi:MAG: ImmA/IrrE family metallo-endopeptidase [Paludibacteraceae bacterium]|nr:ImmA/IrrE family metallo-endopeptidase [Paludibacteraceae bacterium]